ncbi:energy-coupling factor transporter transmembrane component T family protein [Actinotalea solisilvae]|uniref:energy-coupling factor transporter transmembrane component T family protein n=1 Tax=Actinotalea solisilvae TaxID=2072922 RepID=UPI0018F129E5|nr:energy-coupling factor transporter transmembrane component T [Actinotalea solisilvae]
MTGGRPVTGRRPGAAPAVLDAAALPGPVPVADHAPRSTWLGRCDPSVLLAVVVVVPVVLVRVVDPRPLAALWTLAVLGAATAARVPARRLALAQLPFVWFGASVLAVNAVTRDGTVVAVWAGLEVTDVGVSTGAGLAVRTLLTGVLAVAFWHVTEPERLLGSLHQVARLPVRASCALLAAYRLLDDLPQEWATIRRGQAARDPRRVVGGRVRPGSDPASLARAAFALLATSVRRADRVAATLESRGLGALPRSHRTVWHRAAVGPRDAVLVGVVGAAVVVVLAASAPA